MNNITYSEKDFINYFVQNSSQLMWFLGAGTSRTSGMPTAGDIIWDLKRKYYCNQENQNLQNHDINNPTIKQKIQNYLSSKGFPALNDNNEYSFYFDLTFGNDNNLQQRYIREKLDAKQISLSIGQRSLAALLSIGLVRIIFTTNFDDVVETAYSLIAGKNLPTFHLEGSYAALDALNAEKFPIYAKIHGDFKYQSIKNLSKDLINNDKNIQKCFLAAANRYGLVISGYSGRDSNVMKMFNEAFEQNNPFPLGLFWMTQQGSNNAESITKLITSAKSKGVKAYIIETGTFDILLSKIWRQIPNKSEQLDLKVRTLKQQKVSIQLSPPGTKFPLLRTNALNITELPKTCAKVECKSFVNFKELREKITEIHKDLIFCYGNPLLFWGDTKDVYNVIKEEKIYTIEKHKFEDPIKSIEQSTNIKSFFEQSIVEAICNHKPLNIKRKGNKYYAVIDLNDINNPILKPLKEALDPQSKSAVLKGIVPGLVNTQWVEALSIKMDERNGLLWLLIRPEIWIEPESMREKTIDFLRNQTVRRFNNQTYQLLDAWIKIILGTVGTGEEVSLTCFPGSEYSATFKVNTRTAYSRGGA